MVNKNKRIMHEIVHPVAENYEVCYLVLMFIEDTKIVLTVAVELELKMNYVPFEGNSASIYYYYSIN